jgi:hypothetical protein
LGSDADTLSTEVRPSIDPGCGGGRSRTIVTASKALCFPSGPAPIRQVWKQINHLVNYPFKSNPLLKLTLTIIRTWYKCVWMQLYVYGCVSISTYHHFTTPLKHMHIKQMTKNCRSKKYKDLLSKVVVAHQHQPFLEL